MAQYLQFKVLGTKCSSCEILLERELKQISGVHRVHASHSSGLIKITVEDGVKITPKDLEALVGKHGYRFADHKEEPETVKPFSWKRFGGILIVLYALYLVLKKTGLLTFSPEIEGGVGLGAVFVIGLIAAVSSCTAVVGGLLAAVSSAAAKNNANASFAEKIRPHALFNAGRLVGFAGLGALLGLVGKGLTLSTTMNGVLVILVAAMMLALGVNLLELFPKSISLLQPPKWLAHKIHDLSESHNPSVPFILGALTFFLPCGFTQSMQLFALSTGSPVTAAVTMLVFALGTMPALLGIGMVTSVAKGKTLRWVTKTAGALVVVIGISNLGNGAALLGWNIGIPSGSARVSEGATMVNGEHVIQMEVTSWGTYEPDILRVKAGVPVRWQVYGGTQMGCGSTLIARAFNIQKQLNIGMNEIQFTPTKPGRYAFTCSMGMFRGTIIVEA